jgi:hypothetical protein
MLVFALGQGFSTLPSVVRAAKGGASEY